MTPDDTVVLGVDVGGTASRAAVVTLAGRLLGYGQAGGGNPTSLGRNLAAANVARAVRSALSGLDPGRVRAGVLGIAGGVLSDARVVAAFDRVCRDSGLNCPVRITGDVVVAFFAGTAHPSGAVLIAGTGAIAAEIRDGDLGRTADGLGWLLGDEGSGFWLGRAAVREVVEQLSAGRPPGLLGRMVADKLLVAEARPTEPRALAEAIVANVYLRPPAKLATLGPLISGAAAAGDETAYAIVRNAAGRLVSKLAQVQDPAVGTPIVLSGSVLTSPGPIQDAVRQKLARRWNAPVVVGGPGAAGAAWLAATTLGRLSDEHAASLHTRLRAAVPRPQQSST